MDISQLTVLFWLVSHVSSIYFGGIPHGGKKAISTKSEIRLSQQPGLGIYPWKYIKDIFLIKLKNIKFKRSMRKGKQFYKDRRQNKKYLGYGKIDKKSEERYKKPFTRRGRYQEFRASEGCYKKSSARRYERFHASKEPTKKQYMKYFTRRERHEDFRAQKALNKNYSRSRRPYKTSSASTRY